MISCSVNGSYKRFPKIELLIVTTPEGLDSVITMHLAANLTYFQQSEPHL